MRVISWDTETCLIAPAQLAPKLVCVTWATSDGDVGIEHVSTVEPRLRGWLEDPEALLVAHNGAFDWSVVLERFPHLAGLIFAAHRANRITDTKIRQQLIDIAGGVFRGAIDAKGKKRPRTYDLAFVSKTTTGFELQKDALRLSYGKFLGTPLSDWPARMREIQAEAQVEADEIRAWLETERAKKKKDQDEAQVKAKAKALEGLLDMIASDPSRCTQYPIDDARATLWVYQAQEKHTAFLRDQFRQTRAAFWLYLSSAWGICVDREGVEILKAQIEAERNELEDDLINAGLVRPDGTRDTKAARERMIRVCREEGLTLVRTDAHFPRGSECPNGDACEEHVCLDAEACDRTGDALLIAYAERTTLTKQLTNDIPALEKGTLYPIHPSYGLAATGRTTCARPNIQNQSKREGFREAFVARPGKVFVQCDYPTLELYTLAQTCVSWFGWSKLAEVLKSGKDPHLWVASIILRRPYESLNKKEPTVKKARDQAKPVNFGRPGGMGAPKFVAATRKQMIKDAGRAAWEALELDEKRAKELFKLWEEAYPEMRQHFERVGQLCDNDEGLAMVETLATERWRGKATFCATCNNGFQALGSDCAKNAGWLIAEAQYTKPESPLWNTRTVAFVHDEFILEADEDKAHEVGFELARLMVEGANEFLPDVPIPLAKMEPTAMKRWSKKAEQRFDHSGRLICWAA